MSVKEGKLTLAQFAMSGLIVLTAGCASSPSQPLSGLGPVIGGDTASLDATSPSDVGRLRLVATNLVAALLQVPEMQPAAATLQIRRPSTPFGNLLVRALEDAGFGLQLVSADQGRNHVSYSQRFAQTESGPVDDFTLAVGRIELSREYVTENGSIYPSSVMSISGTEHIDAIVLSDEMFREQGDDGTAFISGASNGDIDGDVSTIDVRGFDGRPAAERTSPVRAFALARQRYFEADARRAAPDLALYERANRSVLFLDNPTTLYLGRDNKRALRQLASNVNDDDLLVIKACHDADGQNDAAREQAVRVEEEIVSHGIETESAWIAPCTRSSYQHTTSKRVAPIEVVHYRPAR